MQKSEGDFNRIIDSNSSYTVSNEVTFYDYSFDERTGYKDLFGSTYGIGDTAYVRFEAPVPVRVARNYESFDEPDTQEVSSTLFINGHLVGGEKRDGEFILAASQRNAEGFDPYKAFQDDLDRKQRLRQHGFESINAINSNYLRRALFTESMLAPLAARMLAQSEARPGFGDRDIEGYFDAQEIDDMNYLATDVAAKYVFPLGGRQFAVSDAHPSRRDHSWATLYPHGVSDARQFNQTVPTYYYQSLSHGVWRALLARSASEWYAKGMGGNENSADAPVALQKALSILHDNPPELLPGGHMRNQSAELIVPLASRFDTELENNRAASTLARLTMRQAGMNIQDIGTDYSHRPSALPIVSPLARNSYSVDSAPDKRLFYPAFKPDFSKESDSWEVDTALYGRIKARVVPSRNGKVQYIIYEAPTNTGTQRWIATAQTSDAAINSLGLANVWPGLADEHMKPPIDYSQDRNGTYDERRIFKSRFDSFANRSIAAYLRQK